MATGGYAEAQAKEDWLNRSKVATNSEQQVSHYTNSNGTTKDGFVETIGEAIDKQLKLSKLINANL